MATPMPENFCEHHPVKPKATTAAALAEALSVAVGEQCPECGSRQCEDNGATEYRCAACDHRWGVERGEPYGY